MTHIEIPETDRFDRRTLLRRATVGGLAVTLGGAALSTSSCGFGSSHPEESGPAFVTGYNDSFLIIAEDSNWTEALSRLRHGAAGCMRQNVGWNYIQGSSPHEWAWDAPGSDMVDLRNAAAEFGLKILPVVTGFPAWAADSDECGLKCRSDQLDRFGTFVAETLRFLDEKGVVDAVEIWNEPNLRGKACLTYSAFADLITAATSAVESYQDAGRYSKPMRVIAGGLFMWESPDPEHPGQWTTESSNGVTGACNQPGTRLESNDGLGYMRWGDYFDAYTSEARGDFDVAIHIYDLSPNCGPEPLKAVEEATGLIMSLYEQTKSRWSGDIWVTEVGCSSRPPYGEDGQALALAGLSKRLAAERRCRSMIVHRLYDHVGADVGLPPCPPHSGPSATFDEYAVFSGTQGPRTAKPAYSALAAAWKSHADPSLQ